MAPIFLEEMKLSIEKLILGLSLLILAWGCGEDASKYEEKVDTPEAHLAGTWNFDTLTSDSAFCLQGIEMEFDQITLREDETFEIQKDTLLIKGEYQLDETHLHFVNVTLNGQPEKDENLPIHEISDQRLIFKFQMEVCEIFLHFKRKR